MASSPSDLWLQLQSIQRRLREGLINLFAFDTLHGAVDQEVQHLLHDYTSGLLRAEPQRLEPGSPVVLSANAAAEIGRLAGWYRCFSEQAEASFHAAIKRNLLRMAHHPPNAIDPAGLCLYLVVDFEYSLFPLGIFYVRGDAQLTVLSIRHVERLPLRHYLGLDKNGP